MNKGLLGVARVVLHAASKREIPYNQRQSNPTF